MVGGGATWGERLAAAAAAHRSLLCVGLDPDPARLPSPLRGVEVEEAVVRFNAGIVEATADLACAYKPNLGFYLGLGLPGLRALERTRRLLPAGTPAILDAKIGDVASTATAYARGVFDALGFDAVTLNPYLGEDALAPFLGRPDRGLFIVCKTSNPGAGQFQDLPLAGAGEPEPLFRAVARRSAAWAATYPATVGLVVGATWPDDLAAIRRLCPEQPILLPGVGAQAGDLERSVRAGLDARSGGLLVNASRAILYAGDGADWAERARESALQLRDAIEAARARGD